MVKKVIGMKLEEGQILKLKKKAKENGLTITDLLMQGIKDAETNLFLQEQIKTLQDEIKELQRRNGTRPKTTEYISVPVTRAEKETIRELAFKERTSLGRYIREILTPRLPALSSEVRGQLENKR